MKTTRKNFIKTGAILAGGLLLNGNKIVSAFNIKTERLKKVRDNFFIYNERGGTIGVYINGDIIVVVDSQFADTAKNLHNEITNKKINLLFNTHHHGDHTSGNLYFKDYTSIIAAHEKCVEFQKKAAQGTEREKDQVYANITFADEWTMDLGKEKVWAKHICPAHTAGDAVIHFVNSNVVHVGDLVFNKTYPFIDLNGGGNLHGWVDYLIRLNDYFDKDTIFVFGHAKNDDFVTGNKNDLTAMKNYLSALIDFVSNGINAGKTKEEISSVEVIPGVVGVEETRPGFIKMNLERAFDLLIKNK